METIAWRQSLLIINRNNQIRSDARNHDSRHGQTYREAVLFPRKKDYSRLLFLRQRLLAKHEKRYSRDNHSIIREALQVLSNSLELINRTSRSSMNDVVFRKLASLTITGRFSAISCRCYIIIITLFFYNVHFTSPYDDVAPVFLQLTSIPARGGNISQHNETHRNNVTNQSRITRSTDRS